MTNPFDQFDTGNPFDKFDGTPDAKSGAPLSVRAIVGGAQKPSDRLLNLRKYYPDAEPYGEDNFIFTDPATGRKTIYNPKGFDVGDIASVGGEVSEYGGGVLGAAMAVPPAVAAAPATGGASLLGIPAAYGLGAAGGREAFDLSMNTLGGKIDTRNVGERTIDAAVTGGVNAAGARAGELVEQGVRAVAGPVRRAFQQNAPGQGLADAAQVGVTPLAGMATGNRGVQIMENALSNTPGGASVMQEAAERALREMDQAARNVADDYSRVGAPAGTPTRVRTPQGAGETLRQGSEEAGERYAARRLQLDENLGNIVGNDTIAPVANVQRVLTELEQELAQAPASRAPALRAAIKRAQAIVADAQPRGGVTFRTLRSIRTDLGRELERPDVSGYSPASEATIRRLYGALAEDIGATAQTRGPDAVRALQAHDRYVRFNRNVNLPAIQKIADAQTDEAAFRMAMNASEEGGTFLARLRRNVTPEQWDVVSSSVLSKLGRARPNQQEASGVMEMADDFSVNSFLTNWSKLSPEAKRALFGGNRYGNLIPELDALVRTAGRFKDADKMANPSGTARNAIAALAVFGSGGQLLQGDYAGAGYTMGGAVLAPRVAARLITSPGFVNWLGGTVNATGQSLNNWGSRVARLTALAKAEPTIREEIYQYLSALRDVPGATGAGAISGTARAGARQ